jgi:hypothetical protein
MTTLSTSLGQYAIRRFALRLSSQSVSDHEHEPPPGGCGGQAAGSRVLVGYLAAPAR